MSNLLKKPKKPLKEITGLAFGIIACLCLTFILTLTPDTASAAKGGLYTIQIKSFPEIKKDKIYPIYNDLTAKGHLVYYYRKQIDKKLWIRIHVGLFADAEQARVFGEQFSKTEGFDYFVTKAVARITDLPGGARLVSTPSALWKEQNNKYLRLLPFDKKNWDRSTINKNIPATLTLSGAQDRAAILYIDTLYGIELDTGKRIVLADSTIRLGGLCRSTPRWSPGDKWIAFFDCYEWEVPTGLWLVGPDGEGPYPLTDMEKKQQKVKDAIWHPDGDGLFFIMGYAYGTVSVGGSLYHTDLNGNHTTLVTPGERQEIAGPLSISKDMLHYNLVTFDENYEYPERTAQSIPLPRPIKKPGALR